MYHTRGARRRTILLLTMLATQSGPALADEIVDGDTLVVEGQRMHLAGIDAFELEQTCLDARGAPWRCGAAARAALAELVQGQAIACTVVDETSDDGYSARCTVRDEIDLGGYLVSAGLALADRSATEDYVATERQARRAAAGAWAGTFSPPWEWRDQQR